MIIYSIIIIFISILCNLENYKKVSKFETEIFLIILLIFVGLRDATGGDYYTYFDMFRNNQQYLNNFSFSVDIGFIYLTTIIKTLFDNFYFFIFVISIINFFCLRYFLLRFNILNFTSLLICFQPFIIYLFMGYVKQGLALSFILIFIVSIFDKKNIKSALFFILAVLFHKSALIFSILFIFLLSKRSLNIVIIIIPFFLTIYLYFYFNEFIRLIYFYLGEGNYFKSLGAYPRIIINNIFAFGSYFYLLRINYFNTNKSIENNFHKFIKALIILNFIVIIFLLFNKTTIADRLNFYTIPTTLILINLTLREIKNRQLFINFLVIVCIIKLNIWLLYGTFSKDWNYNFFPNTCMIC